MSLHTMPHHDTAINFINSQALIDFSDHTQVLASGSCGIRFSLVLVYSLCGMIHNNGAPFVAHPHIHDVNNTVYIFENEACFGLGHATSKQTYRIEHETKSHYHFHHNNNNNKFQMEWIDCVAYTIGYIPI